jgi:hypothetical protein
MKHKMPPLQRTKAIKYTYSLLRTLSIILSLNQLANVLPGKSQPFLSLCQRHLSGDQWTRRVVDPTENPDTAASRVKVGESRYDNFGKRFLFQLLPATKSSFIIPGPL